MQRPVPDFQNGSPERNRIQTMHSPAFPRRPALQPADFQDAAGGTNTGMPSPSERFRRALTPFRMLPSDRARARGLLLAEALTRRFVKHGVGL